MRNYIQKNISLTTTDQEEWDKIKGKHKPVEIWRLGVKTAMGRQKRAEKKLSV
jgi:hypothetical protein